MWNQKLKECSQSLLLAIKQKERQTSLTILKRKKQLEKHVQNLEGQKLTVEELIFQPESSSSTLQVVETMTRATDVQRNLQK